VRVAHLRTSDLRGGAARSAFRLHEGLLAAGCDSTMLTREKLSSLASVRAVAWRKSATRQAWEALAFEHIHRNRTPLSNTYFSLGQPGAPIAEQPEIARADVIHLHWVADFLSPESLSALAALGKPMVWTLHDTRPLSGGCHFPSGCRGFEADCSPCPQLRCDPWRIPARNLGDQAEALAGAALTIVAPSRWLAQLARTSTLFSKARVEVIPYGVRTDEFFPGSRDEARRALGFDPDAFVILFGADFSQEKRKGVAELLAALERLPAASASGRKVQLAAFGPPHADLEKLGSRLVPLGYLREASALRAAYSAADVFVLTSLEDNLPNVMLEALACGTPVAAFASGGIPDLVREGETGWTVPTGDAAALAETLARLLEAPALCRECGANGAALIARDYTAARQADCYLALYRTLPARAAPRTAARPARLRRAAPGLALRLLRRRGVREGARLLTGPTPSPYAT
jgi:glycosyltransferase involved in cell wall biosynthesis